MSDRESHLLETMTDGYLAVDRDWRFTYINGAARRLLAVREEFLGQRVQDVFPDVARWLGPYEGVMRGGPPLTFEERYLGPGRPVRVSVYPTPGGAEAFYQDLSPSWRTQQDAARTLRLTEALNAARQLDEVMAVVFEHLRREAHDVLVVLHDPQEGTLGVRYATCGGQGASRPYTRVPISAHLPVPETFRSGEMQVLSRGDCQAQYPDLPLTDQTGELVAVPLKTGGRTLGVLLLSLPEPGTTDLVARSHLSSLAAHCASAIERAQLYDQAWRDAARRRTLLEATSAVLLEVDGDFQSRHPIPTWEAFTGQPFAASRGLGYLDAVHPGDRGRIRAEIGAGVAAAQPFGMEGRLMTAAGVYREVAAHVVPVRGERGEVQMWTGTLRDVTGKRRAQRQQAVTAHLLLALSRAGDALATCRIALAEVAGMLESTGALLTCSARVGPPRVLAAQGADLGTLPHVRQAIPEPGNPLGDEIARGRPFWLGEVPGAVPDPLTVGEMGGQQAPGEVLLVPLHHHGEFTSLLTLGFAGRERPAPDRLEELTWLQPHLAQALQRAQFRAALERSEAQGQAILTALDEGVILLGTRGEVLSVNRAASRLLGLGAEEYLQGHFGGRWTMRDERGQPLTPEQYPGMRAVSTGQASKNELLHLTGRHFTGREGEALWLSVNAAPLREGGRLLGAVVSFTDVTEAHTLRQQLEAQAHQDELTGLPNRRMFNRRLGELSPDRPGAVLLIDLDRFKLVNDLYGHHVGDALLGVTAQRLTRRLPGPALVTRLAGDEYGLILPGAGRPEAEGAARELVALLSQPVSVGGIEFQVSACVGLSVGPPDGASGAELYKHADLALYEAKRSGPGRWCAYAPALALPYVRRAQVERHLRRALRDGQLEVQYQPIVTLGSPGGPQWSSFEALARWTDPELGRVGPAEFIPVAEEAGLIGELGLLVLRRALAQAAGWSAAWGRPVGVSVNVSATQLMRPGFPELVARLLRGAGTGAGQLTLEITEAVVVQDVAFVTAQLRALRELGVRVALDDFGTGFSSLAVLARLPIDVLKVDRAFVRGVHQEPRRQALLSAVVLLGQRLGITVVAEGVEEQRELDVLQGLGCTHVQGYFFARPQPAQAFARAPGEGGG